jgi:hypothetical protein
LIAANREHEKGNRAGFKNETIKRSYEQRKQTNHSRIKQTWSQQIRFPAFFSSKKFLQIKRQKSR